MCNVYNTIGSLTTLKNQLFIHNIEDFKSLKEVMDFQNSYANQRREILSLNEKLIENEKNTLKKELLDLETKIETEKSQTEKYFKDKIDEINQLLNSNSDLLPANIFDRIKLPLLNWYYKRKIKSIEGSLELNVNKAIENLVVIWQVKNDRYLYILNDFDEALKNSCYHELSELERKKTTIDGLNSFIYGAIGEQKVVKALESLSDDYYLINDFSISFSPAIYNRQEKDYIKSIQIDHILIAPSGIFLIETKNWSEQSLENLSLRSPVEQIRRTSFVLFKLLNNERANYHLRLEKHHWGDKRIPIKNLIVLTNTKPKEEFQHVKVLTLNELVRYVNYFQPSLSNTETQRITEYLLNINSQKTISLGSNRRSR